MEAVHNASLLVHIAAGFLGLAAGFGAILSRKGSPTHRRWGRIFAVALLTTSVTTFVLMVLRPSPLLAAIGAFTAYLIVTGWLSIIRRLPRKPLEGWLSAIVILAIGSAMVSIGVKAYIEGGPFFIPATIFTGWAAILLAGDVKMATSPSLSSTARTRRHLFRMVMGMNFAAGAFMVTNSHLVGLPSQYAGGVPNLIFVPVMVAYWVWAGRGINGDTWNKRGHSPFTRHEAGSASVIGETGAQAQTPP